MSREHEYFNCSEEHEHYYVSSLYKKPVEVKEFLKEKCDDGTINNWTHKKLYDYLAKHGFERA